jgi:peptidase E
MVISSPGMGFISYNSKAMNLHLFSTPGKDDIRYILDASRPYLEGKADPVVAYLPAGSLSETWQEFTEKALHGLARIETINTEMITLPEMEAVLRDAALVYIPGGNTFLLNQTTSRKRRNRRA